MRKKMFIAAGSALAALLVLADQAGAAGERRMPGRVNAGMSTTIVFLVTDSQTDAPVSRATIQCASGPYAKQDKTNREGLASIRLRLAPARNPAAARAECVISKPRFDAAIYRLDINPRKAMVTAPVKLRAVGP